MPDKSATSFTPLVRGTTNTQSINIDSFTTQFEDRTYFVPDYQRDSSQWDTAKKSLFIESLINNITVPPLIAYPDSPDRHEIVDGQQRVTTIRDCLTGQFALAPEDETEYRDNVGPLIQSKRFAELPDALQKQIKRYILNIVILPPGLELGLRLEIFRRINEAGEPLSPQDLRLAVFGQSKRVYLIRLAGIYDKEREGSKRMIEAAGEKHDLKFPWKDSSAWAQWWAESAHAIGQAPSQMFLYYVICRDLKNLQTLLDSEQAQRNLQVKYDRSTVSVLDIYTAQLQQEDQHPSTAKILADVDTVHKWFADFERWFNEIKTANVPRIAPNSATKIALFIAAAVEVWKTPNKLTEDQWELVQVLLTQGPGKINEAIGLPYPIAKGKWPGQKKQIEATLDICRAIRKK
jgi:hypothetical protein